MKLNHLLLALLAVFFSQSFNVIKAQVTAKPLFNTPVPVSPQSASLIKSIEFPVDYARGLANISIPLYTISVNDIEIPLVLSYHSSGNKVFDQSGWVGLGWSLNVGPNISRTVQGVKDEKYFLTNTRLGSVDKDYLDQLTNGLDDELPDQFYYTLGSKSGSFLFDRQPNVAGYTIKTLPFEPIKIERLGSNPVQFEEFKIVDDKGIQYYFGGTKRERTDLGDDTGWKGTKIISSNLMDTVYFDYNAAVNELSKQPQSHVITIDDQSSLSNYDEIWATSVPACDLSPPIAVPDYMLPRPIIRKNVNGFSLLYLYDPNLQQLVLHRTDNGPNIPEVYTTQVLYNKEIRFRGGKIMFEIGARILPNGTQIADNANCLKRIVVYNGNNEVVKDIRFNYQEFVSSGNLPQNTGSVYQTRMLLSNVQFHGITESPQIYEFAYNTNTLLPNHFSYDMDSWGYYNGQKNNQSLIPVTTIETQRAIGPTFNLQLGDANRESEEFYMQAGILTQIKHPTAGTTSFFYEANRAYNSNTSTTKIVGGLRIKVIADFDPVTNVTIRRSFNYGIGENDGGNLRHWLGGEVYNPYIIQQNKVYRDYPLMPCVGGYGYNQFHFTITSRFRTLMSNPVADVFYKGEVVAYPEVTEYTGSAYQGQNIGKTVYGFLFAGMGGNGGYETPYFINGTNLPYDTKLDWTYGTPVKKDIFKVASGYEKTVSTRYNYTSLFHTDKIWSRSIFKSTVGEGDWNGASLSQSQYFDTQINEYETGYSQLLSDTAITYPSLNPPIVQVNNYQYDNLYITSPTSISTTTSEGKVKKTKTSYAHEMVSIGQTEPYQEMINRNMISMPIKTEEFVDNVFLSSVATNYSRFWPANPNLIAAHTITTKLKTASELAKVEFLSYDGYGNLLSFMPTNGMKTCYIWSYNNRNLVAEIKNADYAVVTGTVGNSALTGFGNQNPDKTAVDNFLAPLRSALPNAFFTSFTNDPLVGIRSQTDAKGLTTYYEYDDFNRLKNIKDQNGNIIKSFGYHYRP
jgi:hypothetical protein